MANTIIQKRSAVAGARPIAEQLAVGEIAVNTADGKAYTRTEAGAVVELTEASVVDGGEAVVDSDVATYIAAVEYADQQSLEIAVRQAINSFIVGCKADGIWDAIKTGCILAGARTLNGALVPLKGAAPTSFNFVATDYDRKTGLKGDGTTKRLSTNRAEILDPADNCHICVFPTELSTTDPTRTYWRRSNTYGLTNQTALRSGGQGLGSAPVGTIAAYTLFGGSRNNSATYVRRVGGASNTLSAAVISAGSTVVDGISIYARENATAYGDQRLAFYSQGEHLDLALLDARLTALINAIGAAI